MKKRGQVTLFIILGIILLVIIILFLYLRSAVYFGPATPENLERELIPIKAHVEECIERIAPEFIERIGLQGGYLITPEDTYRLYQDIPVSYLCYNQEDKPTCINRMLLKRDMEKDLSMHIRDSLLTCINLAAFKKINYELTAQHMPSVETEIGKDNVLVKVNYPITIKKEDVEVSISEFSVNFKVPLGRLYEVTLDIIDVETEFGEFDQLIYMLAKKGQTLIDKKRPYPDKLYILKTKDSPYIFQFFVEGEPS